MKDAQISSEIIAYAFPKGNHFRISGISGRLDANRKGGWVYTSGKVRGG